VAAAKNAQDRKEKAAELLLRQREADRQDANAAAERDNLASLVEQRKGETQRNDIADHLAATKEIMAHLDAGETDKAQAVAKAYKMQAVQLPGQNPGDTLMEPGQSQQLPTPPAEEGPQATPEIARQAGLIRGAQAVPGDASAQAGAVADQQAIAAAQAERQRFAGAQSPQPQFAGQQTMAPKPGAWDIGGTTYDPAQTAAAEESKRAEEAKRAKEAFAPTGYGDIAGAVATTGAKPGEIGSLVTGLAKADQSQKAREAQKEEDRVFRAQQAEQYRLTAEQQLRHQKAMEGIGWAGVGARQTTASGGAAPEVQAKVAEYLQANPGDQAGAVRLAASLGAGDPSKVAVGLAKSPMKQEAMTVADPETGKVLGQASSPGAATQAAKQLQAHRDYIDSLKALKSSIENDNPLEVAVSYSDASKRRTSAYDEAIAKARVANKLGVAKYNLDLEKGILGGSGAGLMGALKPTASPEVLQKLIDEQEAHGEEVIRSQLKGGARVGPQREPTVGERLTGAAGKKKPEATSSHPLDAVEEWLTGKGY
jgi:hypothetical protein